MQSITNKPGDFQMVIAINTENKTHALCAYDARSEKFMNLDDLEKREFIATHWAAWPGDSLL